MPYSNNSAQQIHSQLLLTIVSERPQFAQDLPHPSQLEDDLLEAGCPVGEIEELLTELDHYRRKNPFIEATRLMQILKASIEPPPETSRQIPVISAARRKKPRFRTMLESLHHMTGGGYGLTTIGGNAKAGKTTFAIGTAIEAAQNGWGVVYFNGELDADEFGDASFRYCDRTIPIGLSVHMSAFQPEIGFTPSDAVKRIEECVELQDTQLLIVLDSINALVDMSSESSGVDYWTANGIWRNWAVRAVRESKGKIAFLIVSETNVDGKIKGRTLEFKSDLVITIIKDKEHNDRVDIEVTHSRSTPAGELGTFKRVWEKGRFTRL